MTAYALKIEEELAERQAQREYRRVPRVEAILKLQAEGFQISVLALNHIRINGRLDYFPVTDKYRDRATKVGGVVRLTKPINVTADEWWYGQQQQFFIRWFFSCAACLDGRAHQCKRQSVPNQLKAAEVTA
jgi:hypothetical protein